MVEGGLASRIWGSLPWLPLGQRGTERKGKERGRLAIARAMGTEKIAKIVGESCQF